MLPFLGTEQHTVPFLECQSSEDLYFCDVGPLIPVEDLACLAEELKDHLLASPPQSTAGVHEAKGGRNRKGKRKAPVRKSPDLSDADNVVSFMFLWVLMRLCRLCYQ